MRGPRKNRVFSSIRSEDRLDKTAGRRVIAEGVELRLIGCRGAA
jgi:hypothetical protein